VRPTWALVALVTGCFSEASSEGGADTGQMCTIGMRGCECGPGGTCDAGLECHGPSMMCYEPDCTLGTAACVCADGMCFGDLQCIDDFCMSPPGTSTTGVDPSTGVVSLSGTTLGTTIDPGTTTMSSADESTTLQMTTAVETSDPSDTDPITTGDVRDGCITCLMDVPQPCGCESCVTLAECIYGDGDVNGCCSNHPLATVEWNEYVSCALQNGCAAACADPPDCN